MAGVRRQGVATQIAEEEIAQMRAAEGLPNIPANGQQADMTEAELAILEQKGLAVRTFGAFEVANPEAIDDGQELFRVGTGEDQFSGRVLHPSGDTEKVWMWRRSDGRPRQIKKTQILFYTENRRLVPRPIPGLSDEDRQKFPCPSKTSKPRCKKELFAIEDAEDHMRRAHSTEYKQAERSRSIRRERQMDDLMEAITQREQGGSAAPDSNNALLQAMMILAEEMRQTRASVAGIPVTLAEQESAGDASAAGL